MAAPDHRAPAPHAPSPTAHLHAPAASPCGRLSCGSGALLERLAGLGYRQLTGVDIRPPASTAAIRYEQADLDLFRLDAPDGSFDLALAVEVIEHIENPGLCSPRPTCIRPRRSFCLPWVIGSNSSMPRVIPPTSRHRAVSLHQAAEPPWSDGAGELGVPAGWQLTHIAADDAVGEAAVEAAAAVARSRGQSVFDGGAQWGRPFLNPR